MVTQWAVASEVLKWHLLLILILNAIIAEYTAELLSVENNLIIK